MTSMASIPQDAIGSSHSGGLRHSCLVPDLRLSQRSAPLSSLMTSMSLIPQDAIGGSHSGGLRHGGLRPDLQRAASLLPPAADAEHAAGAAGGAIGVPDGEVSHHDATASSWREGRRRGRR